MPDDAAAADDASLIPTIPPWLEGATLRAMEQAVHRAAAFGRDSLRIAEAAREIARAHMPAVPMRMIEEAVAAVVPDPKGAAGWAPVWKGEPLREAEPEDVAASLCYAMKFDERGKPRRSGHEYTAMIAAKALASHLAASNFVVMKRPPLARNSARRAWSEG